MATASLPLNELTGRFEYTGTRDYTPFAAIPVSLTFIDDVLGGLPRMRRYNKQLLAAACKLLLRRWRTCSLVSEACKPFPSEFDCLAAAVDTGLHERMHVQRSAAPARPCAGIR